MSSMRVVEYLFQRLYQLGIRSIHGVPGDYNLEALDFVEPAGLTWVGNANELNAGYAADGYARVKGIGAVLTTFGVGELSAINALAGSFAEFIPVVHIVGSPPVIANRTGLVLHHSLGNGDFQVFSRMAREISTAQAYLDDPRLIPHQIDQTLRQCILRSRPVYIQLPTDLVHKIVDAEPLTKPIDLSDSASNKETQEIVVQRILENLRKAEKPCIIVDGCVRRYGATDEVDAFVRKSKLPTFVAPMGKSIIDESYANFMGVFAGSGSYDAVKDFVESSDMVLCFGLVESDFNTTGFTVLVSSLHRTEIHTDFCVIGDEHYDVRLRDLVPALTVKLDPLQLRISSLSKDRRNERDEGPSEEYSPSTITQRYLWPALSKWLEPGDILLAETGTSYLGVWDTVLPKGAHLILQSLWGSIGYTLPAAQGAALAAREIGKNQRVILFEGDGSFQLTAQSISTMLRHNIDIIIFLINNDGYTIERWVHGMEATYNDIPLWLYSEIPRMFGGTTNNSKTYKVETIKQLEALWEDASFTHGAGIRFVEMHMPKIDAPFTLKLICRAAAETNSSSSLRPESM